MRVSCVDCGTVFPTPPAAEEPCPECGSEERLAMEISPSAALYESELDWSPERKVVGAAAATLLVVVVKMVWPELEIPPGAEGAAAVMTAYLLPNRR